MPPLGSVEDAPPAFQRAVESLRTPTLRPEVLLEELPAPRRLAPYAVALAARVRVDETDIALGRLIVLYDPDDGRNWEGPFRVVAHASADLEPEIATDPLFGQVAWSWLTEALSSHDARHHALSGTVTRATTEGFAAKSDQPSSTELELRASWSPDGEDLSGHLLAWAELLCAAAGLPPVDVTDIFRHRAGPHI